MDGSKDRGKDRERRGTLWEGIYDKEKWHKDRKRKWETVEERFDEIRQKVAVRKIGREL